MEGSAGLLDDEADGILLLGRSRPGQNSPPFAAIPALAINDLGRGALLLAGPNALDGFA